MNKSPESGPFRVSFLVSLKYSHPLTYRGRHWPLWQGQFTLLVSDVINYYWVWLFKSFWQMNSDMTFSWFKKIILSLPCKMTLYLTVENSVSFYLLEALAFCLVNNTILRPSA